MDALILVLAVLAALGTGAAAGFVLRAVVLGRRTSNAVAEASRIVEEAEEERKRSLLEAKEEALSLRTQAEADLRERRSELQSQERRLANREENIERRADNLDNRERHQAAEEKRLEEEHTRLEEMKRQETEILENLASLSVNDARDLLMRKAEEEIQYEVARRYRDVEQVARDEADQNARKVITLAIHRLASDVVSENSVKVISLPNDDMKGRLIGREGRNIRAIEAATGVDLIIDDTPEAVTISCFDPVRREIARQAITKLISDGRIHPARIEEVVEKTRNEVEENIREEGERAVFEAKARGMNPELVKLLGRLKYRYSYGENILQHSVQVSQLSAMLAAEIGANIEVAKLGGLLHDIGKALTHEVEGPHAEIGADVARRYGIPHEVERAIMEHHDEERGSVEAFIVAAADAISAARPGSRRDTLEHYAKRLEELEKVAQSFPGVEKSYAIQAGREVRILVKSAEIDDVMASKLARDVVKKIEDTLVYPGLIKVTVIRETRAVEVAR
ncbi:MAG: ribonuclease Y [Chloroflexota bacterium]|nr:ribonuclease Y [Chloroflexota bacterium]MDE2941269.1 ribonuclease Y [Chloroflexota bacterium]MDE3267797.1 ribonuclease Y [Chloroflexota bacterium]